MKYISAYVNAPNISKVKPKNSPKLLRMIPRLLANFIPKMLLKLLAIKRYICKVCYICTIFTYQNFTANNQTFACCSKNRKIPIFVSKPHNDSLLLKYSQICWIHQVYFILTAYQLKSAVTILCYEKRWFSIYNFEILFIYNGLLWINIKNRGD